jgi:hypothetical protein
MRLLSFFPTHCIHPQLCSERIRLKHPLVSGHLSPWRKHSSEDVQIEDTCILYITIHHPLLSPSIPPLATCRATMSSTRSASAHAPSGSSSGHGSGSPYMNSPFRAYQLWQRAEYPKQVWYFVASGIALLILANVINLLRTRARVNSLRKSQANHASSGDVERNVTATPKVSSWKRTINSIDAAFKIIAFRWTVPYGPNYVLSFTELFFTLGYLLALLIWAFVHCEYTRLSICSMAH